MYINVFAGPLAQSVSDNGPYFPSTHQPIYTYIYIYAYIHIYIYIFTQIYQLIDSTHEPINSSILEPFFD